MHGVPGHPRLRWRGSAEAAGAGSGEGPPELADADLLDLLMAFPSVMPSLPGLLKSLDRLQPRLYSIASSSKAHPREVHLTVSAVRWDSNERTRTGIGSCYLADFASRAMSSRSSCRQSHGFGPPADDSAPHHHGRPGHRHRAVPRLPRRSASAGGAKGKNWLFFGDQKRSIRFPLRGPDQDWQRRRRADTASTSPSPATRRRRSTSSTACRRPPPSSGNGWRRAPTSMSAATPSAWPRTSRTRCSQIAVEQGGKSAEAGESLARRRSPRPAGISAMCTQSSGARASGPRHDHERTGGRRSGRDDPHDLPLLRRRLRSADHAGRQGRRRRRG